MIVVEPNVPHSLGVSLHFSSHLCPPFSMLSFFHSAREWQLHYKLKLLRNYPRETTACAMNGTPLALHLLNRFDRKKITQHRSSWPLILFKRVHLQSFFCPKFGAFWFDSCSMSDSSQIIWRVTAFFHDKIHAAFQQLRILNAKLQQQTVGFSLVGTYRSVMEC